MLKFAGLIFVASYAMGATCESLSSLSIPHSTIVAESVAAGAFAPPAPAGGKGKAPKAGGANPFADLKEFCRVQVTSKPSADSDIKIEYWLPVNGWNGNFEANGNGGWSGSITPNTLAAGMQRGYAAAMTDTGHEGGSASFAMGHPEKVVDFGYRAVHEMATTGRALIKAFYGRDAKHSYWNGCSAGGRQGLMAAQRYPEDFDAIVAGAPAINFTGRSAQAVWIGQATHKDEASALPQAKFAAIHDAVLEACDAQHDGVKDGVLEDPTKCKFDPKTLECKGADAPTCLTSAQVETVRKIYSDVTNPRTKSVIFQGHEPGSENGWNTMAGANVFSIATDTFKYAVFEDTNWDYKTLNFDSDMAKTQEKTGKVVNALDPNLKPFLSRGGKIIQYHGWGDPQISPRSSVEYYKSVAAAMGGASKINDGYRLFMIPGMAHCGGGDATANFDMLAALEQWVEQGKSPDRIEASRFRNGQTDRTRPLCPYPQTANYNGSGSTDESANFSCKVR